MNEPADEGRTVELTAEIISAYVSKNPVPMRDLPALIATLHASLTQLGKTAPAPAAPEKLKPPVPISKSVQEDYIVSLEDGKRYRSLKRHLMANYGLTPDAYRAKWGLPSNYPMVAPSYAAARSKLAKSLGLGQSRRKLAEAAMDAEDDNAISEGVLSATEESTPAANEGGTQAAQRVFPSEEQPSTSRPKRGRKPKEAEDDTKA